MKRSILLVLLLLWTGILVANTPSDGQAFRSSGKQWEGQREYAQARQQYEKAYDWYVQKDSFEQANQVLLDIAYNHYFDGKNFSGIIQRLDAGIGQLEKKKTTAYFLLGKTYNFKAFAHRWLNEWGESLGAYEKAIAIFETHQINHNNVAYAYLQAAQICMRIMDYPRTQNYLEQALQKDSTKQYESNIYIQLINYHVLVKEYPKALDYYDKALALDAELKPELRALRDEVGANIFFEIGQFDKVQQLADSSISYFQSDPMHWETLLKTYLLLAKTADTLGQVRQVQKYHQLALAQTEGQTPNREFARLHCALGDYALKQQQTQKAIAHFQKAIQSVFPHFRPESIRDLPSSSGISVEAWQLTALAKKGAALAKSHRETGEATDLKAAAQHYQLALEVVKKLYNVYGAENAKIQLGDYAYNYFEEAIEVQYQLYQKEPKPKTLNAIFQIVESSKAQVLQEAYEKNKAYIYANIPDSLIRREKLLRYQMAQAMTKKEEVDSTTQSPSRLANLEEEYSRLLRMMKKTYPNFRKRIEEKGQLSLSDFQQYLDAQNALALEYFIGSQKMYLLKISPDQVEVFREENVQELTTNIRQFNRYLQSESNYTQAYKHCNELARSLSRQLCPSLSPPSTDAPSLIIIPDGVVSEMTFDALLLGEDNQTDQLVHHYAWQKAYSANSLVKYALPTREEADQVVFLPGFKDGQRGLAPLQYSQEEIEGRLQWTQFSQEDASLQNFRQQAAKANILHLSTHASADNEPRIELSNASLHLPELYAMDIPARLVVLSTCESNVGQHVKGEGLMSLARGFRYAGTASLIASQWKVNEQSTAKILQYFYQNLEEKMPLAKALQEAKLQYLAQCQSDAESIPYRWAGLSLIGQNGNLPLQTSGGMTWYFLVMGLGLLAGLGWLLRSRG